MLHRVLFPGRSIIFFELPSFIDFQPVVGIELFEGSNEGFLICIKANLLENNCDLVFLSTYKSAHLSTSYIWSRCAPTPSVIWCKYRSYLIAVQKMFPFLQEASVNDLNNPV
jgi:hypothetical protein